MSRKTTIRLTLPLHMVAAATILVNDAHKIEQGYYNGHVEGFGGTVDAR